MFDRIKRLYDLGLYDNEKVAVFVEKGVLTPEQYEEITGEPYA